jgi:hypothetical protein
MGLSGDAADDNRIGVSIKSGKIPDPHFQLFQHFQRYAGETSTIDKNESVFSILILTISINAAAATSRNTS